MKFKLVRLQRNSAETLHGIYARNETERGLVMHVHGLAGNFYENELIEASLEVFHNAGFSVAALNFPGYDSSHKIENYSDFTPALDAWIEALGLPDHLILQGHSLGVHKVLSYQNDPRAKYVEIVRAVSMLAPFDPLADWGSFDDAERERRLQWAKQIADTDGAKKIVFDEEWMFWPMSAGTLVQLLTNDGLIDQVAARNGIPKLAWHSLSRFAAVGENDIYCLPSPKEVVDLLNKHSGVSGHVIPDADHGFLPNLPGLQSALQPWVSALSF